MRIVLTIDTGAALSKPALDTISRELEGAVSQFWLIHQLAHRAVIGSFVEETTEDTGHVEIVVDLDAAYNVLDFALEAILESSGDFEWASTEMVDNIQDTHTLDRAKVLVKELVDPRE
jgi:hypothetical protein